MGPIAVKQVCSVSEMTVQFNLLKVPQAISADNNFSSACLYELSRASE